jgi:hypothetical protein
MSVRIPVMRLYPEDYKFLLDALQVVATFFVAIAAGYLSIKAGKVRKSFSVNLDKMVELHTKIHDRMVEVVALMKKNQYVDEETQNRVRMCASRLNLFDKQKEIVKNSEKLLNGWEVDLSLYERRAISAGELSERRSSYIKLTESLRDRVDSLLRPFLEE